MAQFDIGSAVQDIVRQRPQGGGDMQTIQPYVEAPQRTPQVHQPQVPSTNRMVPGVNQAQTSGNQMSRPTMADMLGGLIASPITPDMFISNDPVDISRMGEHNVHTNHAIGVNPTPAMDSLQDKMNKAKGTFGQQPDQTEGMFSFDPTQMITPPSNPRQSGVSNPASQFAIPVQPESQPVLANAMQGMDAKNPWESFRTRIGEVSQRVSGLNLGNEYMQEVFGGQKPEEFFNTVAQVFGEGFAQTGNKFTGLNAIMNRRGR